MTCITFEREQGGRGYRRFRFEGHASYAKKGEDIVCAALSVLVINTINALDELCRSSIEVSSDEEKGLITCEMPKEQNEKELLLVDALLMGAKSVEKEYGAKFCKVTVEEPDI